MRTSGQVSMEYLIIFGIALTMTIPLVIVYITQTDNIRTDVANAELAAASDKISDYIESVYFMGPPAQRTLDVTFPEGIVSVDVSGSIITFNMKTVGHNYAIVKELISPVTGTIKRHSGRHIIVFVAQNSSVSIEDK